MLRIYAICHLKAYLQEFYLWSLFLISAQIVRIMTIFPKVTNVTFFKCDISQDVLNMRTAAVQTFIQPDSKVSNNPFAHVCRYCSDKSCDCSLQILKCLWIVSIDVVLGISPKKEIKRVQIWRMSCPWNVSPSRNHSVTKLLSQKFKCCICCMRGCTILHKPLAIDDNPSTTTDRCIKLADDSAIILLVHCNCPSVRIPQTSKVQLWFLNSWHTKL